MQTFLKQARLRAFSGTRRTHQHYYFRHTGSGSPPAQTAATAQETFVVAHHELRLNLRDSIHRHADKNQQRRTAEIEVVAHAGRDP